MGGSIIGNGHQQPIRVDPLLERIHASHLVPEKGEYHGLTVSLQVMKPYQSNRFLVKKTYSHNKKSDPKP